MRLWTIAFFATALFALLVAGVDDVDGVMVVRTVFGVLLAAFVIWLCRTLWLRRTSQRQDHHLQQ